MLQMTKLRKHNDKSPIFAIFSPKVTFPLYKSHNTSFAFVGCEGQHLHKITHLRFKRTPSVFLLYSLFSWIKKLGAFEGPLGGLNID
jgi:hypothetical protein